MLKQSLKVTSILLMTTTAHLAYAGSRPHMPELLPPSSAAGECYARVEIPAQYSTKTKTVMVEGAHAQLQVTEPELRSRQEQVLVKEASVRYNVRQPTYRSVTDQVMVRPAYERLSVTRPQFKTVTETIGTSKPRLVWKRGNPATLRSQGYIIHSTADAGQGGRGYRSTAEYGRARSGATLCGASCEIWCLVEAPGQTASYNRKVMTSPGDVQRIVVPAKYNTITKQVVADRGGVEEVPIPAEYRAITVEEVVRPASVHKVKVPPKFAKVEKKKLVSPERYEWRRVVCAPGTRPPTARSAAPHQPRAYSSAAARSSGHAQYGGSSYSRSHVSGTSGHSVSSSYQPRSYGQTQSYTSGTRHISAPSQTRIYSSPHAAARTSHTQSQQAVPAGLRGSQTAQTGSTGGTYYYGSDLPTYSEDYTKPAVSNRLRGR